ncbi:monovalent cation/H(+) antiporter subunit G [Mycolicibacterium flavescens]|uniref:Sodium:proton antiporter n=1 Tax=Mycolicibacterium flavescens TaxID=1776 RepID=A0A1E3RCR0_MYCFV|nr:monovalent cation/H(+) antiporter subunit G [Mycolicibacterium flavescens]MCV7280105.1 monovalent cation/H(+) antiporter subunit G [Mycolicibacterium flavescens]ODQ87629.1 sodium:proton antiporter [Mycolicibacterium flavescens]
MISVLLDILGAVLLFTGLALLTISVVGMLRFSDTQSQLHAQGLATGPGVIAVLASSIATENPAIIGFAALTIAFVVMTSPTSSHAISRSAYRRRAREKPEENPG